MAQACLLFKGLNTFRVSSKMDREQLEHAIAALEAQRAVLGDAVAETSLKALRRQLEGLEAAAVAAVVVELRSEWEFTSPVPDATLEKGIRMYLAVMEKVEERGYEAISLVDVDGVKKLLHFPPAMPLGNPISS